jgi:hypothetical protein
VGLLPRLLHGDAAIVVRALAATLALLAIKVAVHALGWEFIGGFDQLTGLMGGVVFTLAILLAAVLADFKESERLVGEAVSTLRRIHWDLGLVAQGDALQAMRGDVLESTRRLHQALRDGTRLSAEEVLTPLESVDRGLREAMRATGATPPMRTLQVHVYTVTRVVDRLEVIVRTTFVEAAYAFAGAVVGAALLGLVFTSGPLAFEGLFLFAFASFLLVGVYWLIAALDHPFAGGVRLDLGQLAGFEAWLAAQVAPRP